MQRKRKTHSQIKDAFGQPADTLNDVLLLTRRFPFNLNGPGGNSVCGPFPTTPAPPKCRASSSLLVYDIDATFTKIAMKTMLNLISVLLLINVALAAPAKRAVTMTDLLPRTSAATTTGLGIEEIIGPTLFRRQSNARSRCLGNCQAAYDQTNMICTARGNDTGCTDFRDDYNRICLANCYQHAGGRPSTRTTPTVVTKTASSQRVLSTTEPVEETSTTTTDVVTAITTVETTTLQTTTEEPQATGTALPTVAECLRTCDIAYAQTTEICQSQTDEETCFEFRDTYDLQCRASCRGIAFIPTMTFQSVTSTFVVEETATVQAATSNGPGLGPIPI
ncbi:hypothetical protein SpCBS45565_g00001 [Spizellomyces sp. 'palustris']|nr:hypothetical protein SpCBS45565_g00001 [Spizellomyces sp. 'palustris']